MSDYFEWMDSYSVGVPALDEAHKQLMAITNDIIAACMEHKSMDLVTYDFIELLRYTRRHFSQEEDMMRDSGFDEFEDHRRTHDALFDRILKFMDDVIHNRIDRAAVAEFMMDWLLTHILETDMRYKEHFAESGIS